MADQLTRPAYPDLDKGVSRAVLALLDEAGTCAEHWKILIKLVSPHATLTGAIAVTLAILAVAALPATCWPRSPSTRSAGGSCRPAGSR